MGTNKRTYRARAAVWGLGESGTGKEQVAVEFKVLTEGAAEQSLTWYGYFTDGAIEKTIESLRNCGWQGDDLSQLDGLGANEVDIVVEDETYEGKTTARVQWVNKVGALAIKTPLTPDRAKSFAAAMKDRIRAVELAGGKRTTPKPASAPTGQKPLSESDIPF